jgi:hypothetical protein
MDSDWNSQELSLFCISLQVFNLELCDVVDEFLFNGLGIFLPPSHSIFEIARFPW